MQIWLLMMFETAQHLNTEIEGDLEWGTENRRVCRKNIIQLALGRIEASS